jgi:hypothetical protein
VHADLLSALSFSWCREKLSGLFSKKLTHTPSL